MYSSFQFYEIIEVHIFTFTVDTQQTTHSILSGQTEGCSGLEFTLLTSSIFMKMVDWREQSSQFC